MRTYQFEAIINEQGMIALPRFRSNLNQHRVKLTLIDSPESPLDAVNSQFPRGVWECSLDAPRRTVAQDADEVFGPCNLSLPTKSHCSQQECWGNNKDVAPPYMAGQSNISNLDKVSNLIMAVTKCLPKTSKSIPSIRCCLKSQTKSRCFKKIFKTATAYESCPKMKPYRTKTGDLTSSFQGF